ncbi:hypothetical protein ABTN43_19285, partial [Acinetobacter baumannii]
DGYHLAGVSSLEGITIKNQTVAGLKTASFGDVALTGFSIQETSPGVNAIVSGQSINQGSSVSLVDGYISVASDATAIQSNIGSWYGNNQS